MKYLIAIACVAVTAASGYYLVNDRADRQKAAQLVQCREWNSNVRTWEREAKNGSLPVEARDLFRQASDVAAKNFVKAGCV